MTQLDMGILSILQQHYNGLHGLSNAEALAEIKAAILAELPEFMDGVNYEEDNYPAGYNTALTDIKNKLQ